MRTDAIVNQWSTTRTPTNAAIKVGGTTLKNFYSADGSPGYFKFKLNVYGREGLDCKRCKTKIAKTNINKRATYYCSSCQS